MKTATEPSVNDFRYTGQQDDRSANRGLYYLRARFYDPALGRFLTRDPMPFVQRYAYVGNNPVNLNDPSGLCDWAELCAPSPSFGIPLPSVPDDIEWPDIQFNANVKENWERHIDWVKSKFGSQEGRREASPQGPPQPPTVDPNRFDPICTRVQVGTLRLACRVIVVAEVIRVLNDLHLIELFGPQPTPIPPEKPPVYR
ncbi:MAG: RHS repeat-associated core domain-containing protein [Chloroflexi bacterium]|nr:RHS repeat-associated core domain-containing protein [Chloroflexota bacterium]